MTQMDVLYRYGMPPNEIETMALGRVREVYGIRGLTFDEAERTVRVEYDATRMGEPTVQGLLLRSGLDIVERVSLLPPQPVPEAQPQPAAS